MRIFHIATRRRLGAAQRVRQLHDLDARVAPSSRRASCTPPATTRWPVSSTRYYRDAGEPLVLLTHRHRPARRAVARGRGRRATPTRTSTDRCSPTRWSTCGRWTAAAHVVDRRSADHVDAAAIAIAARNGTRSTPGQGDEGEHDGHGEGGPRSQQLRRPPGRAGRGRRREQHERVPASAPGGRPSRCGSPWTPVARVVGQVGQRVQQVGTDAEQRPRPRSSTVPGSSGSGRARG